MRQLRVDKYHVLNIAPPEYHKMVKNTDFQFFLDFLIIDDYDNFRLPTRDEYIHIYNRTNYIIDNYQYLTSSPITKRIHRFAAETTTIGYIDTFHLLIINNNDNHPQVLFDKDYKIGIVIPVCTKYHPTIIRRFLTWLKNTTVANIVTRF